MSNETDLDLLARNVHEWPGQLKAVVDPLRFVLDVMPGEKHYTSNQWLSRRAELQNKPSWSSAPEWAQYLVQNSIGLWTFTRYEPHTNTAGGWSMERDIPYRGNRVCVNINDETGGEVLGDWRDTLEQRPVDAVRLEQPAVVAGTGAGSEPDANTCAALIADTLIRLRDFPDHFSAHELADLRQLCDAELTKRDAVICGGQKYLDAHWFERGELPPVGVECTAVADGIPDANCVIVAISTDQVVVKWTENQMFDVLEMPVWSFRPIRTEREAAVSEMMAVAAANWGNLEGCCEALYDAGYRKGG